MARQRFAQAAVVGVLHYGDVVRHLQADFVARFAFGGCGSLKHGKRVFGQAFQAAVVFKIKREGIGSIQHILRELGGKLGGFGLQGG